MKTLYSSLIVSLLALTQGCALNAEKVQLDPVGPALTAPSARTSSGLLLVFSAFDTSGDFSGSDAVHHRHTDYKIFSADGKALRIVRNDSGTLIEGPVPVELSPGTYRVAARANGYGMVTIPLVIIEGKTTIIHLEGGASWPDKAALELSSPVRLPDGRIVGWRADASAVQK